MRVGESREEYLARLAVTVAACRDRRLVGGVDDPRVREAILLLRALNREIQSRRNHGRKPRAMAKTLTLEEVDHWSALRPLPQYCIRGHALAGDNVKPTGHGRGRYCVACTRERDRRRTAKRREGRVSKVVTSCRNGHTSVDGRAVGRRCSACRRAPAKIKAKEVVLAAARPVLSWRAPWEWGYRGAA